MNGDTHFDELNILERGQNHGFPNSQYPTISPINDGRIISPIRDYEKTTAPSQAIFYSGNKYPEISNSFIFVSHNHGNIHSLKISKKYNQTYVDDRDVDLKRDLPENIVSVAQSPTGDLYYGGYYIYKVQSISSESKSQVFPVTTNLSDGIDIKDMRLSIPDKSLLLHIVYTQNHGLGGRDVMNLDITEGLLNDIFSVSGKDSFTHQKYDESVITSSFT